jgi:hypothetical protein
MRGVLMRSSLVPFSRRRFAAALVRPFSRRRFAAALVRPFSRRRFAAALVRPFSRRRFAAALVMSMLVGPHVVLAQAASSEAAAAPGLRVAVLRSTEGNAAELANSIDGALLRDLAALAGIENPTVSPIDYAEIQLTVGCSDEGRECLAAIAQMVQVDAVVVRHLVVEGDKSTLTLVHFDATASDEPAHAEQIAEGPEAGDSLIASVPSLVRRLFGIPEPITAAAPATAGTNTAGAISDTSAPAHEGGPRIGPLTWVALGVGTAVLATGVVFGLGANSSFDDFKHTEVTDDDSAARADKKLDSANTKGTLATILIPSGAAILALGATLLVMDLNSSDHSPEVAVAPLPGGAFLSLRTRAGGL